MPSEAMWRSFFRPAEALRALGLRADAGNVVDLGCGYGTFTIPAARIVAGTVHAFDIEPSMIQATVRKADAARCLNVRPYLRDFVTDGTGLADSSVDYVMLFNLLHAERPEQLLDESRRVLVAGGRLAIMHWNHDPTTPRGPPMEIRPRPGDCARWAAAAGFRIVCAHIDLPPYHYGVIAARN